MAAETFLVTFAVGIRSKPFFSWVFNPTKEYGSLSCESKIGRQRRIEECSSTGHGLCHLSINKSNDITMAKKAKKVKSAKGAELRIVNPDAAGIDIADGIMQVCIPADRSKDNNRAFGAYTSDLHAISAWLRECGIKTVAMESTGVYWIPLFCRLQEDGLDVVLTNARDVKNITERKPTSRMPNG